MFRFCCLLIASCVILASFVPSTDADTMPQLSDERQKYLNTLFMGYQNILRDFMEAYKAYETIKDDTVKTPDQTETRNIFFRFKEIKTKMQRSRSAFEDFLATSENADIILRAGIEGSKIKHQIYIKLIEQICFEILGRVSDLTTFRPEEVSGDLQAAFDLILVKYDDLKTVMLDVDQRLHKLHTENGLGDLLNELQILNDLNKIMVELRGTRNSISVTFLSEINRLDGEGKQLNMIQRADIDVFLATVVWFESYVKHYQELVQKMVGTFAF